MLTPRSQSEPSSSTQLTFKCSLCSSSFEFKSQLILHEMSHKSRATCQVCSKRIFKDQFEEHMAMHLRNKTYLCDFCGERAASKSLMLRHLQCHLKYKNFYCETCGKGFNDKRHYKNHQLTHVVQHPFKCDLCPKGYKRKQLLEFHMIGRHQTERKLNCTVCDFTSNVLSELQKHRLVHLKNLKCPECDKEFREGRYLRIHVQAVHVKSYDYQCLVCDRKFVTEKYVKRHLRFIHKARIDQFKILKTDAEAEGDSKEKVNEEKSAERKTKRAVPVKTVNSTVCNEIPEKIAKKTLKSSIVKAKDERKKTPEVKVTSKRFKTVPKRPNFITHENLDEPESPKTDENLIISQKFKSEPISENFTIQSEPLQSTIKLETPEITIETEKIEEQKEPPQRLSFSSIKAPFNSEFKKSTATFKCATCQMTFEHQSSLLLHEIKHKQLKQEQEEENFKCDTCEKTFESKLMLEMHINVRHVTVKTFSCSQCDFKTTKQQAYRAHKATHREVLYKCGTCSKTFATETLFRDHRKTMHLAKDYYCEICGRYFKEAIYVKRHMKTVHTISAVECNYCHAYFQTREDLNKHIGGLWRIKKCSGLVKG